MEITSIQNPRIKNLVKLRDDRRQRQRDALTLVEGRDEILLAIAAGHRPQTIVTCPKLANRPIDTDEAETLRVAPAVFDKLSYRENPDGWMAVFSVPHRSLADLRMGERPLIIVAESVEKPGNLGAILRTADAAGVNALLVCDPRVDLFSPNVVRASRGAIFSVPAVEASNADALDFFRKNEVQVIAATPSATQAYTAIDMRGPVAIAVGTEDKGLTSFWLDQAEAKVLIPMSGQVNSLNVSIATALIVYEAVRQRAG